MTTTVRDIRTVNEEKHRVVYSPASQLGFWSALLSLFFALGYSLSQLLSWLKVIQYPHDQFWLFFPSLFLAPAFLVTMICLHYRAPFQTAIWSAVGVAFAAIYCTLATMTYFSQLGSVVPGVETGDITAAHPLIFKARSYTMAIDCLGYFFMSLSTLFTAFSFRYRDKGIFRWMLSNGLLIVILIPAFFYSFLYYIGSVWLVTFSMSMIYTANFMRLHVFADERFYNG
jgi:hypothetical protein